MIEVISPRDLSIEEVSNNSDIVSSDKPFAKILITDTNKDSFITELSVLSITSSDSPKGYSGRMRRSVLFSAPMIVPISYYQVMKLGGGGGWRFYHKTSPKDFGEQKGDFLPNIEAALALGKLLVEEWNKHDDVIVLLPHLIDMSLVLTSPLDVHRYANSDERIKIEMKASTARQLVALVSTFAMLYPEYIPDDLTRDYRQYVKSKLYLATTAAIKSLHKWSFVHPSQGILPEQQSEQLKKI